MARPHGRVASIPNLSATVLKLAVSMGRPEEDRFWGRFSAPRFGAPDHSFVLDTQSLSEVWHATHPMAMVP